MEIIRFYRVDDEYGCFSNFSPHPVKMTGSGRNMLGKTLMLVREELRKGDKQ